MISGLLLISINGLGVNKSCFLHTHSLCAFSFFFRNLPLLKDSWPGLTLEHWTTKDFIVLGLEMDNTCWTSGSRDGGWKRCTVMVLCSDQRWFLRKVHWVHVRSNCDKSISPTSNDAHAFLLVLSQQYLNILRLTDFSGPPCLRIMLPCAHKQMIVAVWSVTPTWPFH